MDYIEVHGKTLEDAITEAGIQLGATSDQLDYEIIEKGSSGFLGLGAKEATIRVRKIAEAEGAEDEVLPVKEIAEDAAEKITETAEKAVEKTAEKKAPKEKKSEKHAKKADKEEKREEKREEKPVNPIDVTPFLPKADAFLDSVFKAMDMDVTIDSKPGEDVNSVDIELSGDNMGLLIGKRGQTLDSLQYLTSLVINEGAGEYIRVKLDTENYRERRKATLENLAKNMANKVKRTHRSVTLDPMNPYERRIIHSALQQFPDVDTHSEGEEPYRKVVITLNRRK